MAADRGMGEACTLDFRFGEFEIDLGQHELRRSGRAIRIELQVFDVLVYLIQNRTRIVSKDELIEAVWQGRIIPKQRLAPASARRG
jgi:DNA-binding winged helix-turn-helix (wHTH) protein